MSPVRPFLESLGFVHHQTSKSGSFFRLPGQNLSCHEVEGCMVLLEWRRGEGFRAIVGTDNRDEFRDALSRALSGPGRPPLSRAAS